MGNRVDGQTQINSVLIPAGVFVLRFAGTCAVFYLFFLCRMIGAGDIKLMGLIVGFSGLWDGIFILGLGFVTAAVSAACRMTRQGTVWLRLERIRDILKRKVLCGWGRICSRATVCFC